jgi:hypothetical protein
MWVALSFQRNRLRHSGLPEAEIFDAEILDNPKHALVFIVSNPQSVEIAAPCPHIF